jgi:hypothetical protein
MQRAGIHVQNMRSEVGRICCAYLGLWSRANVSLCEWSIISIFRDGFLLTMPMSLFLGVAGALANECLSERFQRVLRCPSSFPWFAMYVFVSVVISRQLEFPNGFYIFNIIWFRNDLSMPVLNKSCVRCVVCFLNIHIKHDFSVAPTLTLQVYNICGAEMPNQTLHSFTTQCMFSTRKQCTIW